MEQKEFLDTQNELEKLINVLRKENEKRNYFGEEKGKTFIPKELAEHIMEDQYFKYDGNFLYLYESGVYREVNDIVIRKRCVELLGNQFKKSYGDEVVHFIKLATYKKNKAPNTDTTFINVKNGLLEWKNRKLHPHSPEYFSTIQLPIEYNLQALPTNVDTFIRTVVPEDTISMVYEWFGYAMLPTTLYEKAMMLIGEGSNGKSNFIGLLESFIGTENMSNIPLQDLEHNRFKLAQVHQKLVNTFADIPAKPLEKSSIFKTIVSGDRTSAEFKGKDSFNFKPYVRLIFSANELPGSADLTNGFFRRWLIIPFNNKFGPGGIKADPYIMDKLTTDEELSGLLNYALDGLERLEKQGHFSLNESTNNMLEQYKLDIDNVATFVDEHCTVSPEVKIEQKRLHREYNNWCFKNGYKPITKTKFYSRMRKEYQEGERPHGQPRTFQGISLES